MLFPQKIKNNVHQEKKITTHACYVLHKLELRIGGIFLPSLTKPSPIVAIWIRPSYISN